MSNKILIGPAGTGGAELSNFEKLKEQGLDAVEIEFVYGIWMSKEQAEKIRELNKKLFQENKERIMLINNSAGGIGLDLPDLNGNYPRQTIISPDDSAVKIRQVTGRVWRENSKSKSIQTIFFIKGTAEENVMDNVKNKLNNLDILNDGDMKI